MTAPIEEGANSDLKGTVLCIEDSPINMFLVEAALAAYPGVKLLKARTGTEGIRIARAERPDLVLLDMHLPDIGGLEVVRALNEEATSGKLEVVLLTGDTLSMDILKALSIGASTYWRKPLSVTDLQLRLKRTLNRSPGIE
jgi:two-component system cell cycle response regulator DivK